MFRKGLVGAALLLAAVTLIACGGDGDSEGSGGDGSKKFAYIDDTIAGQKKMLALLKTVKDGWSAKVVKSKLASQLKAQKVRDNNRDSQGLSDNADFRAALSASKELQALKAAIKVEKRRIQKNQKAKIELGSFIF